jgi:hypothetical protein
MSRTRPNGDEAVSWIQTYCLYPNGPERGQHVRLTPAQRDIVRRTFAHPDAPPDVTGPMAAYLALFSICGPRSLQSNFQLTADIFTVWSATGPDLRVVLKREGEAIVCPALGTRYPTAA